MDLQALRNLRADEQDCPSELELDEYVTDGLSSDDKAKLSEHVETCAKCQTKIASRKARFAAFPEVHPDKLLAGIEQRLSVEAPKRPQPPAMRRFVMILTPVFAAAAALALIVATRGGPVDVTGETVREKGSLVLRVHRLAGNHTEQVLSGSQFAAGDKLRFVVDLPGPGQINILGVESKGGVYVAWPSSDGEKTQLAGGKFQELPGAIVLDSSMGKETLYLVSCPTAVVPATACRAETSATGEANLACKEGCLMTPFVMNKK